VSEDESEGAVVSLAQRRARAEAREREEARKRARQQARASSGERSKPWLTYAIIGLNALIWVAMVGTGVDGFEPAATALLEWGGNLGLLTGSGQWWRLLTAMFLHAGILHLAFNLYFAWVVGRVCEQIFGGAAYAVVYFGSGVIASLVSALWQPAVVSIGASGALFGVFGAFLAFTLRRRSVLPEEFVRSVRRNALVLIGVNLAIGIAIPGIDVVAHVAGLAAGFGIGYLIAALAEKPVENARQARAVRARAIGAALIATALVVAGGVFAMPRWDNPLPVFEDVGARHDELFERYDALELPADRIDMIENELLPFLREAEAALAELDRVPEQQRELVDVRVRYFQLRQQAFELELDGMRSNDAVVLAEAENLHARAIAELR
jgi:membrane associated rhomboid family serine protease